MTTATAAPSRPPAPHMAAFAALMGKLRPGQRVVLTGVDWAEYESILSARAAGSRWPRLSYDEGVLEAMTTTSLHERLKKTLSLLIEAWVEETGGRCIPGGGMTVRREDIDRGFEPDDCYYIRNCDRVIGKDVLDFTTDPPPDIVVEVEVTRTVLGRLPVMAAFRVPEVWRYDGDHVIVLLLQPDGSYRESPASHALPALPLADLSRYLARAAAVDYSTLGREFRAWVRSLPPAPPP